MVQVIDTVGDAGGAECIRFRVRRSRRDPGKFKPKLHVKTAISDWIWRPSVWNWTIDDFGYARGGPLR